MAKPSNFINLGVINSISDNGFTCELFSKFNTDLSNAIILDLTFNNELNDSLYFKGSNSSGSFIHNGNSIEITTINSDDFNIWMHIVLTVNNLGNATLYVNNVEQNTKSDFGIIKNGIRDKCYLGISSRNASNNLNYPIMDVKYFRLYDNLISSSLLFKSRRKRDLFVPYLRELIPKIDNVIDPTLAFEFRNFESESEIDYLGNNIALYSNDLYSTRNNGIRLNRNELLPTYLNISPNLSSNSGISIEFYTYIYPQTTQHSSYKNYIFYFNDPTTSSNISLYQSEIGIGLDINNINLPDNNNNQDIIKNYENKLVHFILIINTSGNNPNIKLFITDDNYWNINNELNEVYSFTDSSSLLANPSNILNGIFSDSYIGYFNQVNLQSTAQTTIEGKKMDIYYFRIWNDYNLTNSEMKLLYQYRENDEYFKLKNIYTPKDDLEFKTSLFLYFLSAANLSNHGNFGRIEDWDTKNVTNMDCIAYTLYHHQNGINSFNELFDISYNELIQNIEATIPFTSEDIPQDMFGTISDFNIDLSKWNTTNVTSMKNMFREARSFNQDVSKKNIDPYSMFNQSNVSFIVNENVYVAWDTSNVKNMDNAFNSTSFNQPLDTWDTSNVTNMTGMFVYSDFNQVIQNWNVSNVTQIEDMFFDCSFNQPLNNWNVSNVNNMKATFANNNNFNQSLSNWDVSNVTDMNLTFFNSSFNQDIRFWNLSTDISLNNIFQNNTLMQNRFSDHYGYNDTPIIGFFNKLNITTKTDLLTAVSDFLTNQTTSNENYGFPKHWDISNVNDMSSLFKDTTFNEDISNWQVSHVTNFNEIFSGATLFNQPLNNWNISNTNLLISLFNGATAFNQSLNNWDVSNVLNLTSCFQNATSFNQPLNNWNVSNCINFKDCFNGAISFNQEIRGWSVDSESNFTDMFIGATAFNNEYDKYVGISNGTPTFIFFDINGNIKQYMPLDKAELIQAITEWENDNAAALIQYRDINTWNTSLIADMQGLFNGRNNFNSNISNWDVSSVTNMAEMFHTASSFNQPLNSWDISSVTDMALMFYGALSFNQPLDSWDVSSVTTMDYMFDGASAFNQDISGWIVSNITNMEYMFNNALAFNKPLDSWIVSNVKNMQGMFHGTSFNQPLNSWNVSNVTMMYALFAQTPFNQPLDSWDVSNVTHMSHMFNGSTEFNQDISDWIVSNVTNVDHIFDGATSFNKSIGDWDISNIKTMRAMFSGATSYNGSMIDWDVSNVTDMDSMFFGATSFNKSIGDWVVSNVTNMRAMFNGATSFNKSLGEWDTTNVKNMVNMFNSSSVFNRDISSWNVSNVTDMSAMFYNNLVFNQDISNWQPYNCLNFASMFFGNQHMKITNTELLLTDPDEDQEYNTKIIGAYFFPPNIYKYESTVSNWMITLNLFDSLNNDFTNVAEVSHSNLVQTREWITSRTNTRRISKDVHCYEEAYAGYGNFSITHRGYENFVFTQLQEESSVTSYLYTFTNDFGYNSKAEGLWLYADPSNKDIQSNLAPIEYPGTINAGQYLNLYSHPNASSIGDTDPNKPNFTNFNYWKTMLNSQFPFDSDLLLPRFLIVRRFKVGKIEPLTSSFNITENQYFNPGTNSNGNLTRINYYAARYCLRTINQGNPFENPGNFVILTNGLNLTDDGEVTNSKDNLKLISDSDNVQLTTNKIAGEDEKNFIYFDLFCTSSLKGEGEFVLVRSTTLDEYIEKDATHYFSNAYTAPTYYNNHEDENFTTFNDSHADLAPNTTTYKFGRIYGDTYPYPAPYSSTTGIDPNA